MSEGFTLNGFLIALITKLIGEQSSETFSEVTRIFTDSSQNLDGVPSKKLQSIAYHANKLHEAWVNFRKAVYSSDEELYEVDDILNEDGEYHEEEEVGETINEDDSVCDEEDDKAVDEDGSYWDEDGGYWDKDGGYWDNITGGYWDNVGGYWDNVTGCYWDSSGGYWDDMGCHWVKTSDTRLFPAEASDLVSEY